MMDKSAKIHIWHASLDTPNPATTPPTMDTTILRGRPYVQSLRKTLVKATLIASVPAPLTNNQKSGPSCRLRYAVEATQSPHVWVFSQFSALKRNMYSTQSFFIPQTNNKNYIHFLSKVC